MILYYIDTYILLLLWLFYIILYRYRAIIATDTRNILTGRKQTGGRWDFFFFLTASKCFLELIYYVYLLGKQHNMSPLRSDSSTGPKWGSQLYHRSGGPFPATHPRLFSPSENLISSLVSPAGVFSSCHKGFRLLWHSITPVPANHWGLHQSPGGHPFHPLIGQFNLVKSAVCRGWIKMMSTSDRKVDIGHCEAPSVCPMLLHSELSLSLSLSLSLPVYIFNVIVI